MKQKKKIQIYFFVFCMFLTSCYASEHDVDHNNDDQCIGSFEDYAYDKEKRSEIFSEKTNKFVNPAWLLESSVPDEFQVDFGEYHISGERIVENEMQLWIQTDHLSYYSSNNRLFNNHIMIYNTSSKEWSRISPVVQNCDCIADDLFFDNAGNIWAKNAGNSGDERIGKAPVLSKFNFSLNVFEPIEITSYLFSGSLGEQYERIYYSDVLYDGKDSIWIFDYDGDAFIFNVKKETITSIDLLQDMRIRSVTYDRQNDEFYLLHQNSNKRNFLGIPSDFGIIKFYPAKDQIEYIKKHPYNWPDYADLWIDQNGSLWFDTFGYLDSDQKWHLLMPNIGSYIFNTYIDGNPSYAPQKVIAETSDGKLWFEGRGGIAWRSIDNLTGCWDSIYESDVYEDSNNRLWLINFIALYSRENK